MQIMGDVGVNFQQSIAMATNLEVMVQLHSAYLQSQYDRCFLGHEASGTHTLYVCTAELGI